MIEPYIIDYLGAILTPPVSGSVPHPMPDEFVTVEKTGGSYRDRIHGATIAVQSWSTSRGAAAALNELVKAAMDAIVSEPEVNWCQLNSDYNYPDLETNRPRYQAVFDVIYFNEEEENNA